MNEPSQLMDRVHGTVNLSLLVTSHLQKVSQDLLI